ncbi:Transcriptional regulator of various polyols utilization, AraC family [Rubellimicrobium mesophilum DSM 19309]|uniref:Transcriptional regulator of various polyols utilization, AraC family n=1 Tax=Rubellimicrobium mesophilum DSM 19309 TaxID=442562 RepID=A0A017HTE1_9RHOB|nr:AraC family transcriptional regulator [Rubellimicrobium mesophilum]EYD77428.1 Transcriptional regulator of various polyols utilization, AraC family [Rubellimicrobium mesophilum DSM 19309]
MKPDLEVVQIGRGESFRAWSHGYPFHTVRWHFHPECEIHYVAATTGRYFVGDFIGEFGPGNLVMTGPNLPHNWISHVAPEASVPLRSHVVQFPEGFVVEAARIFPELAAFMPVLELSRRGALFGPRCSALVAPMLAELTGTQGIRRVELFVGVLRALGTDADASPLASPGYLPDPSGFMSAGVNEALAYLNEHLTEPFTEGDLAAIAGRSPSAFSRSFRRHTGMGVVQYVNRLRINLACQLLMSEPRRPVTEICFATGFNNLSNFNRQFLAQKGVSPSRFRTLLAENVQAA